ncbi:transporter [Aliikangiella coralliicola]|uniref:Transporter n=1 Tax=Aliikangiella coralliicola TaxID=2592383 RepID=A0A545UCJ5_9GAMM|nr:transporter [Aliikangiella coralliicola]TQV87189.1 transporter [Aliikangiella coralliicola]
MKKSKHVLVAIAAATLSSTSYAHDSSTQDSLTQKLSRPDSHAPLGVMADHLHNEGEWMFSYRYMRMEMSGNRSGTDRVSTSDVLNNYMVAPLDMPMDMHMLGTMYAPSNDLTLMLMLPYLSSEMDHLTRMGMNFTTKTSGIGDIKFSALNRLWKEDDNNAHWEIGLSLPTGEIDERGNTPAGNIQLPYPMQLGSGTYDAILGFTYNQYADTWSSGVQARGIFRLGENDNDYTVGDKITLSGWTAKKFNQHWSGSLRLSYVSQSDYDGADPSLNPMMVPTANTDLRGGEKLFAGLGMNFIANSGHRLALEWETPLWQDLDGPQLEIDSQVTLGWQYAF